MSEAKLLRALADKIDELDAAKEFPAEIGDPGSLTVSWTEGSDHPGYQTLSDAIGALVKQHWNALRSQVIKQRETEVQTARAAWNGISEPAGEIKKPAPAPMPPDARMSPEPSLRRASMG